MAIEVTPEAVAVLRRSLELAGPAEAPGGIRLRAARGLGGGVDVQVELAESAAAGDEVIEAGGVSLFVDPEVRAAIPDAVVTVEPQHEVVVVRPAAGRSP
jgi:Fe-S cluster assembly iron-binding protein IscA